MLARHAGLTFYKRSDRLLTVNAIQAIEHMKTGKSVTGEICQLYRMCHGDFVVTMTPNTSCAARVESVQTADEFIKQHIHRTEFYGKQI